MLVQALDLAMQQELNVDEMYEKCIGPLADFQKKFLAASGADAILDFVEGREDIPDDWPIKSLDAEDKIRELHTKLVAGTQ